MIFLGSHPMPSHWAQGEVLHLLLLLGMLVQVQLRLPPRVCHPAAITTHPTTWEGNLHLTLKMLALARADLRLQHIWYPCFLLESVHAGLVRIWEKVRSVFTGSGINKYIIKLNFDINLACRKHFCFRYLQSGSSLSTVRTTWWSFTHHL